MKTSLLAALLVVCLLISPTLAQEQGPRVKGRLPNNYGQVGLSQEQREEIYRVQAEYSAQLEVLIQQIEELKALRDKKIHDVLTADQKQRLAELIKLAEARKAQRTKPQDPTKTPLEQAREEDTRNPPQKEAEPVKPAEKEAEPAKPAQKDE